MANMGNVMGIIFANTHDEDMHDLTKLRTVGSVPFGGRYRLIDFPLSNMVNSGIMNVGVITKSNYLSLLDHLQSGREWDLLRKDGGLVVLPPFSRAESGKYKGSLEALAGAIGYINDVKAEYVVMSDSNIIANMDYREFIEAHKKSGADVTAVYFREECTGEDVLKRTIYGIGADGRINEVLIRPKNFADGTYAVSANIFVLGKKFFEEIINESAAKNLISFEVDFLQRRINDFTMHGYEYKGYYDQLDSVLDYFKANMNMLDADIRNKLFLPYTPIYTKIRDEAPVKYGIDSSVTNSLVADGCVIEGTVENCILFRGVTIGKGAIIKNSIIMQDTVIGNGCEINYTISDKDVTIADQRVLQGSEQYPVFINKGTVI